MYEKFKQQISDQFDNQMYTDKYSQNFYALIRHGERADNIDIEECNKQGIEIQDINDPPLTPLGIQ